MTPAEAVKELAQGLTHPDEVAKRLWEAGLLSSVIGDADSANMYCPVARYVHQRSGFRVRVGIESWYAPERRQYRGHLPRVLMDFVQLYDNGDYDNLTNEEATCP